MAQFVCILCTCLATWLWMPQRTPAARLARIRSKCLAYPLRWPASRPHAGRLIQSGSTANNPSQLPPTPSWLDTPSLATTRRPDRRTLVAASCAGLITGLVLMGIPGIVVGVLAALLTGWTLHRREPPEARQDRDQITADLPFAADLMVACLLAGQPVSTATENAAQAVGGPLGKRLTWVSGQLRLGADPEPTWALLAPDPSTGHLARTMSRAALSGAPVADVLTRLADDARESARTTAVAAARRVGVKAVAPLGLCFLPAFVLLGIVPVVAGLAGTVLIP